MFVFRLPKLNCFSLLRICAWRLQNSTLSYIGCLQNLSWIYRKRFIFSYVYCICLMFCVSVPLVNVLNLGVRCDDAQIVRYVSIVAFAKRKLSVFEFTKCVLRVLWTVVSVCVSSPNVLSNLSWANNFMRKDNRLEYWYHLVVVCLLREWEREKRDCVISKCISLVCSLGEGKCLHRHTQSHPSWYRVSASSLEFVSRFFLRFQ